MKIKKLSELNIDQVMTLFCDCFEKDTYYLSILGESDDFKERMDTAFRPNIEFNLRNGVCYGVFDNDRLIAFFLGFDYNKIKSKSYPAFLRIFSGNENCSSLPYEQMHAYVESLSGQVLFCLAIAVAKEYQRRGIAAGLIDYMLSIFPECHFVADVSNESSLSIYKKRGFDIKELDKGYFLVSHIAGTPISNFEMGDTVTVALAGTDMLNGINYTPVKDNRIFIGLRNETVYGVSCFIRDKSAVATGIIVSLEYGEFLKLQRFLNVSHYSESAVGGHVIYTLDTPYTTEPLYNQCLRDMIKTRKTEWSIIPDIYISVPVQYENEALFSGAINDSKSEFLLKELDFRSHYEAGIPTDYKYIDDTSSFKKRIKRYYLGKIKLQIASEVTVLHYDDIGEPIGAYALVDAYISLDKGSNCAVLTLFSLSAPFLISHLLDNMIRNQLTVIENGRINLYEYLEKKYRILKRGTPKAFLLMPFEKDRLDGGQISSLLAAETIYPDGESFGKIVDNDITAIAGLTHTMGQYDRCFVSAYTNVVIQFSPDLRGMLTNRFEECSITLFYIELILFEEAAIQISNRETVKLFNSRAMLEPVEFLKRVESIHDNYSKTIDFWNIQVNYPTSQKSIDMLRNAFEIDKLLQYMHRNQEQLQSVFNIKCDIADRKESHRTNSALAVISLFAVISAWVDGFAFYDWWNNVFDEKVILILQRVHFGVVLAIALLTIYTLFGYKIIHKLIRKFKKGL